MKVNREKIIRKEEKEPNTYVVVLELEKSDKTEAKGVKITDPEKLFKPEENIFK